MFRRKIINLLAVLILWPLCGCALLVAGAVGGAGTAIWLSDKLVQEVSAPMDKALIAAKKGLKELDLAIEQETVTDDVAQLMSRYHDGKKVWVDIHQITLETSRIEVRVGITGDELAARNILDHILKYL